MIALQSTFLNTFFYGQANDEKLEGISTYNSQVYFIFKYFKTKN